MDHESPQEPVGILLESGRIPSERVAVFIQAMNSLPSAEQRLRALLLFISSAEFTRSELLELYFAGINTCLSLNLVYSRETEGVFTDLAVLYRRAFEFADAVIPRRAMVVKHAMAQTVMHIVANGGLGSHEYQQILEVMGEMEEMGY